MINRPSTCRDATWHFGEAFWFRSAASIPNFDRLATMSIFVGVCWLMAIESDSQLPPWYGTIVDRQFAHTTVSKKGTAAPKERWQSNTRNGLWRRVGFASMV